MTQVTEQTFEPVTFTIADPRTFDGDPYEVAERACKQAAGVAAVLDRLLEATDKMARNAEMERAFAYHEEPQGSEWPNSALGKRFGQVRKDVATLVATLNGLAMASGYNPKRPNKS